MATIADLNVRLGADSKQMISELNKAAREFRKKSREMAELADNMFTAVTLPVIGLGAAAISSAADIERLTNAMASTMGSAEAAAKEIELLRQAAAAPGLDFEQAIKGSVRLQAVGMSAEDSRRALSAFGNALALAGGSASDLDGIALALGQIAAKGKVSAEEINQLAERTPQIRAAMKDAFGTADTEQLQKMGITAEKFISEIITSFEKLPKATGGLTESMTNFQTSIKLAFATLGNSINTAVDFEGKLNMIANAINGLANWFKELSPETQKFIVYTTLAAAAIGPMAKAIAALSSLKAVLAVQTANLISGFAKLKLALVEGMAAFKAMDMAMRLTVIGVVATAITGLVLAFQHYSKSASEAEQATRALAEVQARAKQAVVEEEIKIDELIAKIKDENTARAEKQAAIQELQKLSPDIFKNLTLEGNLTQQLADGKKKYIEVLMLQAEAEALYNSIVEKKQKIIALDINNDEAKVGVMDKLVGFLTYGGDETKRLAYEQALMTQRTDEAKEALQGELDVLQARSEEVRKQLSGVVAPATPSTGGGATAGGGGESTATKQARETADVLAELEKKYTEVAIRAQLFGNVTSVNGDRAELLRDSITELLDMGLDPSSEQIQNLIGRYKNLTETLEPLAASFTNVNSSIGATVETVSLSGETIVSLSEKVAGFLASLKPDIIEDFKDSWDTLRGVAENFGSTMVIAADAAQEAIFDMVNEGETNLKDFANAAAKAAAKVVRTYIMQGVAAVVKDALEKFGILGLAIGAAAGAGAGMLFNVALSKLKVPAFAQGGLVYGPQLAMVGDNPGAATDPEVIAPLSKLQSMMGRSQEITGVVRVAGSDLLIMLENAQRNQKRYGT